ncbi:MAG: phosphoribosylanthranilate isomerase [Deltaproteobacteria bacterium]|nr:phosphoribosylanthranilate isomerase [Deltaproteobacteria bacterium]
MVKVKICGITNYSDALVAVESGADALGFIFASGPRHIEPPEAREIICGLPPFIKTVGVFVDEDPERIQEIISCCSLDLVQLHGNESPDICERFMPGVIKAVRVKDRSSLRGLEDYKGKVRGILLDAYSEKAAGGTGMTFNWDLAVDAKGAGIPLILAGGLGPSNITEAVSRVEPYAVDVSSGVEERPGKKNHALIRELFEKLGR